ncbi:replicative DNA helicase [Flavobacterium algicola]|uniref:replicative DNA helicase n=1 Tax=Flavobacterium algicola TaxID=556529 RepID=UPI001EFE4DE2|nr:replicative DNA helicase [Flavobacterium algicola]MCG9792503.1 replicative DNA helicase [Flavobacterium algicola]
MSEKYKNPYQNKQTDKSSIISLERGKIVPQSIDTEQAVLGALLIDANAIDECMIILKSSDVFFKESHKVIFEAISDLYSKNESIDMITVGSRLRSMGKIDLAGGDYALVELTQKIASGAHIEFHSRLLQQFFIKRQLIRDASMMLTTAFDDSKDSLELLNEWSESLDYLNEQISSGKKNISFAEGLDLVEKRVEFLTNKSPEEVTGALTGFNVIDQFTGGYQPGELIVDAARPGMGKTAKMMKCAVENAKIGNAVGIVSAEMSAVQLVTRAVAIDTSFHLTQLTKKGFEKPEYFQKLSGHKYRMKDFPIHIDDSPSPDIRAVSATLRMWKRKFDIKIAIVDYLQLLSDNTKSNNREQEIASISRKLKGLAKELGIPIIALSQLSRAVETRGSSKRPMLSDLRESGAIEQDADMVCFIYRSEYYDIEVDEELAATGANSEIIFAKYRGGAPGTTIGLHWDGSKTKFEDPAVMNGDSHDDLDNDVAYLPSVSPSDAFDDNNEKPF